MGIFVFLSTEMILANDDSGTDGENEIPLQKQEPTGSKPPRIPSRSSINCTYTKDYIELSLPADVEYMDVTLEQNGVTVWTDVVTIDEPRFEIPNLSGEVIITCITNNDVSYSGTLYF